MKSETSEAQMLLKQASVPPNRRRRFIWGLFLLFVVNLIWTLSSELVQYIFESYDDPVTLTYICNSLFIVYIPGTYLRQSVCRKGKEPQSAPFFDRISIKAALIVAPLWFFAQLTYNLSLDKTSVASSTVIANTSCLFTFLMGLLLKLEKRSSVRLVGVASCIFGAVFVALGDRSDSGGGENSFWGDLIALLSAALYGAYTTAIKVWVPEEKVPMGKFFGFMGAVGAIGFLPLVLLFGNPNLTGKVLLYIILRAVGSQLIADYCWGKAVQFTSPTMATVGLSLTIPFSIVADLAVKGSLPSPFVFLGSLFVVLGFVLVSRAQAAEPPPQQGEEEEQDELTTLAVAETVS